MKTNLKIGAAALALLGLAAPAARAQNPMGDDRAGTAAMEELLVPITPRSVALGASLTGGLNDLSGIEALQSNPAGLLSAQGTTAMFSRTEYVADIGVNYVGVGQRFGANSFAISLSSWDYGDIPRTTEDAPEVDEDFTYSASSLVVGATFARQFTDRIGAGVTLKGLSRKIDEANAGGVAFDAGISYVIAESGLRFGVSLRNFGTSMSFDGISSSIPVTGPGGSGTIGGDVQTSEDELPSQLNFGAAYTRQLAGDVTGTVTANFRANSYDMEQYSAGLEFAYQNLLYVRGGANIVPEQDVNAFDVWTIGAGLNVPLGSSGIKLDYAYRPSRVFDGVNMFSVSLDL
jgi:hypothetical protein